MDVLWRDFIIGDVMVGQCITKRGSKLHIYIYICQDCHGEQRWMGGGVGAGGVAMY